MINRPAFYSSVRSGLFGGKLRQSQMDGMETIFDAWERGSLTDRRWLAYAFATVFHETGETMQPVEEIGKGKGKPYGNPTASYGQTYYGRGYVQLTWEKNYKSAGDKIGIDLVRQPDLAMSPPVATRILFSGVSEGWFTGKKFLDYFTAEMTDWTNARRIINGMDKAPQIAGYARMFYQSILAAGDDATPVAVAPEPSTTPKSALQSTTVAAGSSTMLTGAVVVAGQVKDVTDQIAQIKDTGSSVMDLLTGLPGNPHLWIGVIIIALGGYVVYDRIRRLRENGV